MLSPGQHYKLVPKDREENQRARLQVLKAARKYESLRQVLEDRCREDILFFINLFVYQFNPTKLPGQRVGPFLSWDFQEDALIGRPETTGTKGILWCLEKDKDAVAEKSREMGASWLFLIVQLWLCLFHEWSQCLNVSRNADAVDCKSPDSLFWKLRFMLKYLPDWMRGEVKDNVMLLEFKKTSSYITGEASTGSAGVGGRAALVFVDEFPRIKADRQVREGTASTARCRFFNGTHQGTDTEFYRLTQSPEIVKIVMHWTQHPEKKKGLYRVRAEDNTVEVLDKGFPYPDDFEFVKEALPTGGPHPCVRSPWYDGRVASIGSTSGVAMELDINPSGSVSQFFEPLIIRRLQQQFCRPAFWQGVVELDYDRKRVKAWKADCEGPLKLWCHLLNGLAPTYVYGAGADVATGTGTTNSCFTISNGDTGEKVLEYANPRIDNVEFAHVCVALLWCFLDSRGLPPFFAWECNGPGVKFGMQVVEDGYTHFYKSKAGADGWRSKGEGPGDARGSKVVLLEDYREALAKRWFLNRSALALEETLLFRYSDNGRSVYHSGELDCADPSGAGVNHGDRVMADALAYLAIKGRLKAKLVDPEPETVVGSLAWRRLLHDKREGEVWVS